MKEQNIKTKKYNVTERVFLLTDLCMWEKNKLDMTKCPHAVQVIDTQTGKTRYIQSGSRIKFVDGTISDEMTQEIYNGDGK